MGADEVVVTGIGMVTALGATARSCAEAWSAGRSARTMPGVGRTARRVALMPRLAAAERAADRRAAKYMSAAAALGCAAAREAVEDSGLRGRFPPERVGLFVGAGMAAAQLEDVLPVIRASTDAEGRFSCRLFGEGGLGATNPLMSFKVLANMPACLVSVLEGIRGPNLIFTPREGQTSAAIVEAYGAVAGGEVDCAVTGAADVPSHPAAATYLDQAGLLEPGQYLGAGSAYVVFERAAEAGHRGRRVHAGIAEPVLAWSDEGAVDPLAERLGRTFAAAPAIAVALACMTGGGKVRVRDADGQELRVEVRA